MKQNKEYHKKMIKKWIERTAYLNFTCPKCGKVIKSLYPTQQAYNVNAHKQKHKGGN